MDLLMETEVVPSPVVLCARDLATARLPVTTAAEALGQATVELAARTPRCLTGLSTE